MMLAGYLLYSRFLASKVYQLSDSFSTPAHTMEDGVDYVPTNKYVLWGTTSPRLRARLPSSAPPSP